MSEPDHSGTVVARLRPAHLSPGNIGLVALGGAVGTGLRYGVGAIVPTVHGIPLPIFAVNVVGAFVLGSLLEFLADTSIDVGWSRRLRLGIGTGVLGGFTTYSSLAVGTVALGLRGPTWTGPLLAVGYALATLVIGGLAGIVGIALSRHHLRPAMRARRLRS